MLCTDPGVPVFGRKGSSTHFRELARALAALGERVVVATTAPAETDPPPPGRVPFSLIRLPTLQGRLARWVGSDMRMLFSVRAARRHLESTLRHDTFWAIHERSSLYGTAGTSLARRFHLPRTLEVNALLAEEMVTRLHFPAWAARVERRVLRRAPAIAAISETMRQRLAAEFTIPADRIFLSPMGIDPVRFHPDVAAVDAFARLGLAADGGAGQCGERPALIGYVGSFNHYHRPGWLFDLMQGLRERHVAARCVVIGGAALKVDRKRQEARERNLGDVMHFLGPLPHDELPGWMAAMDVLVVPGAAPHSSPTKIVESAAVGVPVVMPDYPSTRYLAGLLGDTSFFPPEDKEQFVQRVATILADPDSHRAHARSLAPQLADAFSWRRRAEDILHALHRQHANAPPPRSSLDTESGDD